IHLCDAEVDELHALVGLFAARDHQVLRADVAMDDARSMNRIESVERLDRQANGVRRRDHAALANDLRQILAVDELPDHVMRSIGKRREVVQRRDIRMLNFRRELRFAKEALVRVGILRDLRADDLDHADGLEEHVLDFVDLAHAAGAEALDDPVLAVDRLVGVTAKEVCYRLATMRAGFEGTFDFSVTSDTAKWHAETNDTTC